MIKNRHSIVSRTLLLLGFLSAAPLAWPHGINLFATVEGTTIQGTLHYADGSPATRAPVTAYAPDGKKIAEALTDETGRFTFQAQVRCRHRLVGDAGQGHRGLFTIPAEELPDVLPEPGAASAAPSPVPAAPIAMPGSVAEDLDQRVEAAVARQLRPLREQLNGYETSIRIRDVMGGIGYLFGLAGMLALIKSRASRSVG